MDYSGKQSAQPQGPGADSLLEHPGGSQGPRQARALLQMLSGKKLPGCSHTPSFIPRLHCHSRLGTRRAQGTKYCSPVPSAIAPGRFSELTIDQQPGAELGGGW